MTQSKTILISTVAASLVLLAGCSTQPATNTNTNTTINTNTVTNTDVANQNTNTEVVNKAVSNTNTNSDQLSEVDTSDWLTYTNDEYGFSFRHPADWTYEEKSLMPPEEGVLSIRFLSPSDRNIIDSINYTDQPVGIDVRVIESSLSPLQYYQEQVGNLDIQYSETELESGLVGVAYNDPGLSEGIYRNIFSDKNGVIIDIRTFSEQNLQSETFTQFMNFLEFNS